MNAAVEIVQFNSRELQIKENLLFIVVSTFNSKGNAMQCSGVALLSSFTYTCGCSIILFCYMQYKRQNFKVFVTVFPVFPYTVIAVIPKLATV